jgi:glutathione synthase/RimK-type ligase-like ATP-grasp enzyme
MDASGEHFAEFGIDIAIDTNKNLWLIEANVFPSFKGFKKMDRDTYLSIRYMPILYALSLTQFGE